MITNAVVLLSFFNTYSSLIWRYNIYLQFIETFLYRNSSFKKFCQVEFAYNDSIHKSEQLAWKNKANLPDIVTIFVILLSPPYTMNFWKFLTECIIIYSTPKWGWASLHITSTLYYWGDAGGRDFWKHAAYGVSINFALPECNDEKLGENVACGWMVSMSKSS